MRTPPWNMLALALLLSAPALAQTPIPAPAGWTTQTKVAGARTFTPPDLRAGEKYSITVYDSAPLGKKTLEAYLRAFAGPVGSKPGQLTAPLKIGASNAQSASATGIYRGPNGTQLIAAFNAFSFDGGQNVAVSRTLTSSEGMFSRHQSSYQELVGAMAQRARDEGQISEPPLENQAKGVVAKGAAPAQTNGYPFATAPGHGIALSQIALVLHYGAMAMTATGGTTMVTEEFLLLRDGTLHRGLPVPPDELNLAASRRGEPENWGRWRRKGAGFEVSWQGKKWEDLEGTKVEPGAPQTRLSGRYGGASGSSGIGSGSYAYYGVAFHKDGRFQTDRSGGGYSQSMQGGGAASYSFGSQGSVVLGADGVVMSKSKGNPNADREGTYAINGYTLTLRYDNGRVVRQPFFFLGSKREGVLFRDEVLLRDEQ